MSITKRMLESQWQSDDREECEVGPCFGRAVEQSVEQTGMRLCNRCTGIWMNAPERGSNAPADEQRRAFLARLMRELPDPFARR
ncbi:hypothetical protein [Myxococcus vastator]|uniref:hypothetical protein n=1 Tax=Myxococcus vastator TaxID=2709664 RepID=UPI0013D4FC02|nr:hypothetical protein [Myxococcus vastator]